MVKSKRNYDILFQKIYYKTKPKDRIKYLNKLDKSLKQRYQKYVIKAKKSEQKFQKQQLKIKKSLKKKEVQKNKLFKKSLKKQKKIIHKKKLTKKDYLYLYPECFKQNLKYTSNNCQNKCLFFKKKNKNKEFDSRVCCQGPGC